MHIHLYILKVTRARFLSSVSISHSFSHARAFIRRHFIDASRMVFPKTKDDVVRESQLRQIYILLAFNYADSASLHLSSCIPTSS